MEYPIYDYNKTNWTLLFKYAAEKFNSNGGWGNKDTEFKEIEPEEAKYQWWDK